jgi:hypothetical protein
LWHSRIEPDSGEVARAALANLLALGSTTSADTGAPIRAQHCSMPNRLCG